jgi:hypothetical protein
VLFLCRTCHRNWASHAKQSEGVEGGWVREGREEEIIVKGRGKDGMNWEGKGEVDMKMERCRWRDGEMKRQRKKCEDGEIEN